MLSVASVFFLFFELNRNVLDHELRRDHNHHNEWHLEKDSTVQGKPFCFFQVVKRWIFPNIFGYGAKILKEPRMFAWMKNVEIYFSVWVSFKIFLAITIRRIKTRVFISFYNRNLKIYLEVLCFFLLLPVPWCSLRLKKEFYLHDWSLTNLFGCNKRSIYKLILTFRLLKW